MSLRFEVGCDPESEEFKEYWSRNGYSQEFKGFNHDRLLEMLVDAVKGNLVHLIVWREGNEIIGHVIWHEERVDGFRLPGEGRGKNGLERLLGEKRDFVELHTVWLEEKHRGKSCGKKFFEFFEDFAKKRGFDSIVYFSGNPAAIDICRKRAYKEDILSYPEKERWHVFYLSLM